MMTINKKYLFISISFIVCNLYLSFGITAQNVAINVTGETPDESAMLDIKSTNQGVLIPRMTDDQRKELKDPAPGLLIFNTTNKSFNFYNDKGWQQSLQKSVSTASGAGVGTGRGTAINSTGYDPDPSSILDVSSTTKGFLLPRTTPANISNPAKGLIIYNTNTSSISYYNGTSWLELFHSCIDNITGTEVTAGGVAINATGESADESAILDIKSTSQGVLFPRMTNSQRDALNSPAQSLIIYNTSQNKIQSWSDTSWEEWRTDVTNPITGKTWMDRNLGADSVAKSINDTDSYGDLYQWGRFSDGHEKRTSTTTPTQSSTDTPNHDKFINNLTDWRNPRNDNLWQGVNGKNNPCPCGYRIPTKSEWEKELSSWSSNNSTGAIKSPLKLPTPGYRSYNGSIFEIGVYADYWSSTINGSNADVLNFHSAGAGTNTFARSMGFSVRCIKD